MYLVINKWVIAVKVSKFSGQYLRNHWTLDIGVLGYIGTVRPKEHTPEVWSVPPVTPCIHIHKCSHSSGYVPSFKSSEMLGCVCWQWDPTCLVSSAGCVSKNRLMQDNVACYSDHIILFWARIIQLANICILKLHDAELHDLYPLTYIIRVIKSRRMRWAGYLGCVGREESCKQGFGGETRGKETIW